MPQTPLFPKEFLETLAQPKEQVARVRVAAAGDGALIKPRPPMLVAHARALKVAHTVEVGQAEVSCACTNSSTHEEKGYVSRFALPSKLRPSFNMQVLVADDQGINRKLMCQLLSTFNSSWQLVECATAEEAILAAKSNFFPLIVMDEEFGAGVMTGSEAIAAIRSIEAAQGTSDDKSAFIVSWTANSSSLGIPTGANSTWQKPADREIMQVDIDRALQVVE